MSGDVLAQGHDGHYDARQVLRTVQLRACRRLENQPLRSKEWVDRSRHWNDQHQLGGAAAFVHVMRLEPNYCARIELQLYGWSSCLMARVDSCTVQKSMLRIILGERIIARIAADVEEKEYLLGKRVLGAQLLLLWCRRRDPHILEEYVVVERVLTSAAFARERSCAIYGSRRV